MSAPDEVKRRLQTAMRYAEDDWLDRAEWVLDAEWRRRQRRAVVDVSTIGGRLRAAREAMGLSQDQVAIRLGIKVSAQVSDWELGKRNLPLEMLVRLAMIYRPVTTRAWLVMETDEGAPNVPQDVLATQHSRRGYEWLQRKRAWQKAQAEVERRNAERKAKRES